MVKTGSVLRESILFIYFVENHSNIVTILSQLQSVYIHNTQEVMMI